MPSVPGTEIPKPLEFPEWWECLLLLIKSPFPHTWVPASEMTQGGASDSFQGKAHYLWWLELALSAHSSFSEEVRREGVSQVVLVVKNPPANAGDKRHKRRMFDLRVRQIPRRRAWQPTPVFLPWESHGHRSLVGYSPQGNKESDTTEVT